MTNARSLVAAVGTLISILLYTVTRSNSYGFDPQAFPATGTALADSSSYGSFAATPFRPAEVSYEGLNRELGSVYYAIKINTSRRVDRVELSVRYLDGAGRLVFEAPYVWQNITNSKPRPIEAGRPTRSKIISIRARPAPRSNWSGWSSPTSAPGSQRIRSRDCSVYDSKKTYFSIAERQLLPKRPAIMRRNR